MRQFSRNRKRQSRPARPQRYAVETTKRLTHAMTRIDEASVLCRSFLGLPGKAALLTWWLSEGLPLLDLGDNARPHG
jgi:hypothetical protein